MSVYDRDREPPLFAATPVPGAAGSQRSPRSGNGGRWVGAFVLLALLVFGAGVAARFVTQDQPQPPLDTVPETAVQQPPSAEATAPSPPTATEQQTSEPPGQAETQPAFTTELIDDWSLVCPTDSASGQCFIQQRLAARDGETAFVWTISRDRQGVVRAAWQTPADVDTGPGMAVDVGDGQPRTVPFKACDATSCSVSAVLAPVYLDALERAPGVSAIVMTASSGQLLRYQFSTQGLQEALSRLQ